MTGRGSVCVYVLVRVQCVCWCRVLLVVARELLCFVVVGRGCDTAGGK